MKIEQEIDPVKKAQFFGALFVKMPTFNDLLPGTHCMKVLLIYAQR